MSDEQSKVCFGFAMTRKRTFRRNERFRKSDEQSKVCFGFVMTRKRTYVTLDSLLFCTPLAAFALLPKFASKAHLYEVGKTVVEMFDVYVAQYIVDESVL